ncbi:hypothetical protein D3C76_581960 [compost metagenome]
MKLKKISYFSVVFAVVTSSLIICLFKESSLLIFISSSILFSVITCTIASLYNALLEDFKKTEVSEYE